MDDCTPEQKWLDMSLITLAISFPRRIEDSDGLLKYLETSDSWGIVQGAIKEKKRNWQKA